MGKSRIIGGKSAARRGSALIELALLFPVIMLILFGTMDFARVVYAGIAIASAARAGVQYGSLDAGHVGKTTEMSNAAIADAASQGLGTVNASSRVFCGCTANFTEVNCSTDTCSLAAPNGYVETTVTYTYSTIVPYPGIPNNIVLNRVARMRVQ
jgi:Flp pilus assembly protein TadG